MRFNFSKIASTAASTLMVGSTIALAAAANYPAPFVQNGNADVALVYGDAAASSDLVAAIDVTNSLQNALGSGSSGSSGTTTVDGEAAPLFSSGSSASSKIWHNTSINNAKQTLSDNDLPSILAESDFEGDVSADLTHTLTIGSNPKLRFTQQPTSDDDPTWNIELSTSASNSLYNATVDFDNTVNFTKADSEGEEIVLFGQEFTVGSETDGTNLVLFRASETLFLDSSTNPSQTVTVDGETYTIELVAASDTSATIRVTDSTGNSDQKEINEAASKRFLSDLEVAVNTADESDALGSISAEVIIGASKVKMSSGNEILFGTDEESLDGTRATFSGNPAALTQLIFQVAALDSDVDAILPGESLVDPIFGNFKVEFANLANDDDRETITIDSAGDDKMSVSFINHNGDEKNIDWLYNVTSHAKGGPDVAVPTGAILADSSGDLIHVREMAAVNDSQFVMIGNEDEAHFLEVTSITNSTTGFNNDKVTFKDVFSGSTHDASITAEGSGTISIGGNQYTVTYLDSPSTADSALATVRLNDPDSSGNNVNIFPTMETSKGAGLALYQPLDIALDNWDGAGGDADAFRIPDGDGYTSVAVTAPSDGFNWTIGGTVVDTSLAVGADSASATIGTLTFNFSTTGTANETRIHLVSPRGGNVNEPGIFIFEEEDHNDDYEAMVVDIEGAGTSDNGMGVNTVDVTEPIDTANVNFITWDSDTDISSAATTFGSVITLDAGESDQQTATIEYPNDQLHAEVYIAAEGASITGSDGGVSLGSVTVKDTEVQSVSDKNMIIVGGSCINTVAASLLGSDVPLCGSAFEEATDVGSGSFLIESFASPFTSGKIATLVAGYNAGDTTNAATYLRTQNPSTDVGAKYIGSSATSATMIEQ